MTSVDDAGIAAERAIRDRLTGRDADALQRLDRVVNAGGPRNLAKQTGGRAGEIARTAKEDARIIRDALKRRENFQDATRLARASGRPSPYSLHRQARRVAGSIARHLRNLERWRFLRNSRYLQRIAQAAARVRQGRVLTFLIRVGRYSSYLVRAHPYLLLLVLAIGIGVALWAAQQPTSPKKLARGPDCDCANTGGGLVEGAFQRACLGRETVLKSLWAGGGRTALKLKVVDGVVADGELCDSVAHGEQAWPRKDGPAEPPPPPGGEPCLKRKGLAQNCADR